MTLKPWMVVALITLAAGCAQQPAADAPAGERKKIQVENNASYSEAMEKADADDIICTTENKTGSNLPRRVCMTKAERERQREEARRLLERGGSAPCSSSDCAGR